MAQGLGSMPSVTQPSPGLPASRHAPGPLGRSIKFNCQNPLLKPMVLPATGCGTSQWILIISNPSAGGRCRPARSDLVHFLFITSSTAKAFGFARRQAKGPGTFVRGPLGCFLETGRGLVPSRDHHPPLEPEHWSVRGLTVRGFA